ncbi:MAG: class F sortase [Chloroflexota bacterium]|nr:class F sortase [Chloroflexota bacterium]
MVLARRWWRGVACAAMLLALPATAVAQPQTIELPIEVSSTGRELRAGPLGLNASAAEPAVEQIPIAIQIDEAAVDAEVERNQIVDGLMLDPSGPWVVSWYEETGRLGEQDNTVMAGHLDYWGVGPAVFYNLADVQEDDEIRVTGAGGEVFTYQVEWGRLYQLEELDRQTIGEIVGPTQESSLTLITCGGEFDEATGQYLSRYVIRASLASTS